MIHVWSLIVTNTHEECIRSDIYPLGRIKWCNEDYEVGICHFVVHGLPVRFFNFGSFLHQYNYLSVW